MCFFCDKKPRVTGNVACHSCLQEHRKCYECGEKDRNFPFKLCTECYAALQTNDGGTPHLATAAVPSSKRSKAMFRLVRLNTDQQTYKEVNEQFTREWVKKTKDFPGPPQPKAIYAIQNPSLVEAFHKYGDKLRNESSTSVNSDLFFHGTSLKCDLQNTNEYCPDTDCGICGIAQNGFDDSRIGANIPRFKRFGHGIYLAPNSSKCHDYTQGVEEHGLRAQLLCLVACGAKYELLHDDTKLQQPPSQYHSVYGKSGGSLNYDEIVVYDVGAVLPQYIVLYVHDGVHKIAK